MDSGEEIPGLNEGWTFIGCKASEWIAGISMMFTLPVLTGLSAGKSMPILLATAVGTAYGLAALRRQFPDENKGLMNFVMVSIGIAPPGIPAPAQLEPKWSGAPIRELPEKCKFRELGLDQLFEKDQNEED